MIPVDLTAFAEAHGKYRTKSNRVVYIVIHKDGKVETKDYNKRYFDNWNEFRKWLDSA